MMGAPSGPMEPHGAPLEPIAPQLGPHWAPWGSHGAPWGWVDLPEINPSTHLKDKTAFMFESPYLPPHEDKDQHKSENIIEIH